VGLPAWNRKCAAIRQRRSSRRRSACGGPCPRQRSHAHLSMARMPDVRPHLGAQSGRFRECRSRASSGVSPGAQLSLKNKKPRGFL
jgi:hypothetical protein